MIDALAKDLEMPKAQVRRMVDAFIETVSETLVKGEKVQMSGLGTFLVKKTASRQGRNPQTGDSITIAARNVVRFKPAKPLKESVK